MSRLIDADKLTEAIKNELWDWETVDGITATTVLKQMISDISNQPTVDAEPVRQGHWEKVYGEHISIGHRPWVVCCSVCGRVGTESNYCSNCGAKMDEV